jgi:hypothetical protein
VTASDTSRSDLAEQRAGRPVSFEFFSRSQSLTLSLISQCVHVPGTASSSFCNHENFRFTRIISLSQLSCPLLRSHAWVIRL